MPGTVDLYGFHGFHGFSGTSSVMVPMSGCIYLTGNYQLFSY